MIHEKARWIWTNSAPKSNEYAIFEDRFVFDGKIAAFSIAAETDYILYVNGQLVAFGQFAGYPFEKYCDELDITSYCVTGENTFSVTVRYEGVNSATHIDDGAGVIFSLEIDGRLKVCSGTATLGGADDRYIQHQNRAITGQLGLTSGMRCGHYRADIPCVEVKKTYNIKKRPVKKAEMQGFVEAKPLSPNSCIYDLGREEAGYLRVRIKASAPCTVKIAYSEHIADGNVRYLIGKRDFSLDFETDAGEHEFLQLFVRIAARYLEVIAPEEAEILSVGLETTRYPLTEKKYDGEGIDRKIYDTCVRTLRLCMNTHYEDCPWREQALYVLDSRNQMLCGYYAFEETEFQRENLIFISKGKREDGFLELTYPAIHTPAIPFFSMMYPVAVYEYIKHTGDVSILDETMETMLGFMNRLKSRVDENGLIAEFEAPFWNFYEWTQGSSRGQANQYHLILNCALVYSCTHFIKLCEMASVPFDIDLSVIKKAIEKNFFDSEKGIFSLYPKDPSLCSQLGNAFALLIGLGDKRTVSAVKYNEDLIPATLSMLTFVYDALLLRDDAAKDYIKADIRKKYGYMLDAGATTFWETLEGASVLGSGGGSLCHGWSAIPIYYYNLL